MAAIMPRLIAVPTFNWLVATSLLLASVTNIYIRSESYGLYLVAFPLILLCIPFLPAYLALFKMMKWLDLFALAFIVATVISAVLSPNSKSITYVALYSFSTIFMAILLRNAVAKYGHRQFLNNMNALTVALVSTVSTLEFWLRYCFGVNPLAQLPLVAPPLAICGLEIPRVYALSLEPTYLGWYLITLGTVATWHVWRNTTLQIMIKLLFSYIAAFALVVTWSSSTIICFGAAGVAVGIYAVLFDRRHLALRRSNAAKLAANSAIVLVAILLTFLTSVPQAKLIPCLEYVGLKPAVQAADASEDTYAAIVRQLNQLEAMKAEAEAAHNTGELGRIEAALAATRNALEQLQTKGEALPSKASLSRFAIWRQDFAKGIERPVFGWGPGYSSDSGDFSSLNILIFTFLENGGIAAILLAIFLVGLGLDIAWSRTPSRYIFLIAYVSGVLHLMTQTKHFYPYIWLVVALFWLERMYHERSGKSEISGSN